MRKVFLLIVLLFNLQLFSQDISSFVKDEIDNYINRALKDWQFPGGAIRSN